MVFFDASLLAVIVFQDGVSSLSLLFRRLLPSPRLRSFTVVKLSSSSLIGTVSWIPSISIPVSSTSYVMMHKLSGLSGSASGLRGPYCSGAPVFSCSRFQAITSIFSLIRHFCFLGRELERSFLINRKILLKQSKRRPESSTDSTEHGKFY